MGVNGNSHTYSFTTARDFGWRRNGCRRDDLCGLTGKQTIAEFAENAEIIQMLTSFGVDYTLGYGVAQPQRVLKSAVA